jgi:hypothetical protein
MYKLLKVRLFTIVHDKALFIILFLYLLLGLLIIGSIRPKYGSDYFIKTPLNVLNDNYHVNFSTKEDFIKWHDNFITSPERWFTELIRDDTIIVFFSVVFPAFMIGKDFVKRTVNIPIYTGVSRLKTFIFTLTFFYVFSTIYILITIIVEQFVYGKGWPIGLSMSFFMDSFIFTYIS